MNKTKGMLCALLVFCTLALHAQTYKVASYNIRLKTAKDDQQGDGWDTRKGAVLDLIQYHNFDIFGTQEVLQTQLDDMSDVLKNYEYVGAGRDDGKQKGEYSAIFFKKTKFKAMDSGTFWLSEDTEKPNKGWDARYPRVCTWVKLQDKCSKQVVWFFNTHFDHVGKIARSESSKLIVAKIKAMAGKDPVVLTGDFNVDQNNEGYKAMANSGVMQDAYELAAVRHAQNGTINGFKPNRKTPSRIDHIFVSKDWKVCRYAVLTDAYWTEIEASAVSESAGNFPTEIKAAVYQIRTPSDHYPIAAEISLSGCTEGCK